MVKFTRMYVLGLLVLLYSSLLLTSISNATILWSDNFDDGNFEGWNISGASPFLQQNSELAEGNFSAVDKTLRAIGAPVVSAYSFATHSTMTTTGTWSWDLYFNKEGTLNSIQQRIFFIDKPLMDLPFDWNGHEVSIFDVGSLHLERIWDGMMMDVYGTGSFKAQPGTWTHIDVTLDSDGRWRVYANGTLCMDKVDKTFLDFSYFGFGLPVGPAVDNVVVSDTMFVPPGNLKVTAKDSSGSALTGAAVSSTKQPSGQSALSGVTTADGTVTFTGVVIGNYTLQVSKGGYVSGSAQGAVASGAKTELSTTLQAQPSSGIPGFPYVSVVIGVLLCTAWLWLYTRQHPTFKG